MQLDAKGINAAGGRVMDAGLAKRRREMKDFLRKCQSDLEAGPMRGSAWVASKAGDSLEACCVKAAGAHLHADADKSRLARKRCRHRVCPYCHAVRAASVADALLEICRSEIKAGRKLGIFTFTIQHTTADLLKWLREKLARAWTLMTQRALWKAFVREYHRVAEVEKTRMGGWHPHFHVLVCYLFNPKEYQADYKAGKLRSNEAFKAWDRWKMQVEKARVGKAFKSSEWKAARPEREAEFAKATLADFEKWFAAEWAICTEKAGRKGENIRFRAIKPTKDGKQVWQAYRDAKGKWQRRRRDLEKVLQEVCKYTTKGHARGGAGKRGKMGFLEYSADEVVEYLRAVRGWRLHQSSRGWSSAEAAAEIEDLERVKREVEGEGGRIVQWEWLVAVAEQTAAGKGKLADRPGLIEVGGAFVDLMEREALTSLICWDQYLSLATHVRWAKGEDVRPVPFKLSIPERREVERHKGRNWSPDLRRMSEAVSYRVARERVIESMVEAWEDEQEKGVA